MCDSWPYYTADPFLLLSLNIQTGVLYGKYNGKYVKMRPPYVLLETAEDSIIEDLIRNHRDRQMDFDSYDDLLIYLQRMGWKKNSSQPQPRQPRRERLKANPNVYFVHLPL